MCTSIFLPIFNRLNIKKQAMKPFANKVVWITGASSGFGEALVYELADQGAKVILSARREDELKQVSNKAKGSAILPLDLAQFDSFEDKTQQAIAIFGKIDLLIHNGGIAQNALAQDTTSETQRKIMDVDFFSYTELTKCILPHFQKQGSGHIVVVSGLLARLPLPMRTSYCAAKTALHGYFNSLRGELKSANIAVTILVPGAMQTTLVTKALGADGKVAGKQTDNSGCPVEVVARQASKMILNKKYEAYVGNKDKAWFLSKVMQVFPSFATKMLLKQF